METTSTTAATSASTPQSSAQTSQGFINSDFETFLRMMTTQLQNQDPLNPMDSSDFAVQLATFSNVEQQVRTNALLENLNTQMGLSGMSELASFVGMEARVVAPASFSGYPIEMSLDLARGATSGVLVVTDQYGIERQRLEIDSTAPYHVWEGTDDTGAEFPSGTYTFTVESYQNDEVIDVSQAPIYARVEEARLENGETMLLLNSGATVSAGTVTALRFPVIYEQITADDGGSEASAQMRKQMPSQLMR